MVRPSSFSRSAARPLAAWAALLALLVGGVDLHALAGGHPGGGAVLHGTLAESLESEVVFACAPGHVPRTHVERARAVERDPCPACLQHLQSRAEVPRAQGPVAAVDLGRAAAPPRLAALAEPTGPHAPPRGPPSA